MCSYYIQRFCGVHGIEAGSAGEDGTGGCSVSAGGAQYTPGGLRVGGSCGVVEGSVQISVQ